MFGRPKLDWLRKFYPYKRGIPSHDVLGKLLARLDHKEFAKCFSEWVNSISDLSHGEVVSVDGKTIRRSGDGHLANQHYTLFLPMLRATAYV